MHFLKYMFWRLVMDEAQLQLQLKIFPIPLYKFALWMVSKP